jgi:uncharacterized protein (UPF0179 family)
MKIWVDELPSCDNCIFAPVKGQCECGWNDYDILGCRGVLDHCPLQDIDEKDIEIERLQNHVNYVVDKPLRLSREAQRKS